MISHFLELTLKEGKQQELCKRIKDRVVPYIQTFPGFVDEIVLLPEDNPRLLIPISFWASEEDSQRFLREGFARVTEMTKDLLDAPPRATRTTVCVSTNPKIKSG